MKERKLSIHIEISRQSINCNNILHKVQQLEKRHSTCVE